MTTERKVAIQMWEDIVKQFDTISDIDRFKSRFMLSYPFEWKNNCWFCEYCRKDYRKGHVGREGLNHLANYCESCPLYKYEIARGNVPIEDDACGCSSQAWDYDVLWGKVYINKDIEAAKVILKILKGAKIEEIL